MEGSCQYKKSNDGHTLLWLRYRQGIMAEINITAFISTLQKETTLTKQNIFALTDKDLLFYHQQNHLEIKSQFLFHKVCFITSMSCLRVLNEYFVTVFVNKFDIRLNLVELTL